MRPVPLGATSPWNAWQPAHAAPPESGVDLEQPDRLRAHGHKERHVLQTAPAGLVRRAYLPAFRVGRGHVAVVGPRGGARRPPGTGPVAKVHAVRTRVSAWFSGVICANASSALGGIAGAAKSPALALVPEVSHLPLCPVCFAADAACR